MRRELLSVNLCALAVLGAGCAAHNAHRVELVPELDLRPLVRRALDELREDYGQALPPRSVAFAVDVDDVDVQWVVRDAAPDADLAAVVEDELLAQLGDAVVEGDRIGESNLRLNAWLLVDLGEIDALEYQLACVLTHAQRPENVLAHGASKPTRRERLRCFGCRDHWFRDTGTDLRRGFFDPYHRRGVLFVGGYWGAFWSDGGGATYTKSR